MIPPKGYAIGIDLGGTNVRVGAVTPQGRLLAAKSTLINASQSPKVGLEKILSLITTVRGQMTEDPLIAIGVGSTGPIDRERGLIQNPYTLPTWSDVDILSFLSQRLNVPSILENDADAAALGEAWVGAGKGYKNIVQVTVGTGIGVGFIQNGQIFRGKNGIHPEGGHMILDLNGPIDYCGAHGCWEILASGPAMERLAQKIGAKQGGVMLQMCNNELETLNGQMIVKAARMGDPAAISVITQMGQYHGIGIVNLLLTYLPDCIVLGGGVMKEFDLFLPQINLVLAQHNIMVPATEIKILSSQLGGQAGIFGAAYAALSLLKEN